MTHSMPHHVKVVSRECWRSFFKGKGDVWRLLQVRARVAYCEHLQTVRMLGEDGAAWFSCYSSGFAPGYSSGLGYSSGFALAPSLVSTTMQGKDP